MRQFVKRHRTSVRLLTNGQRRLQIKSTDPLCTAGRGVTGCSSCGKQYVGPENTEPRTTTSLSHYLLNVYSTQPRTRSPPGICVPVLIAELLTIAKRKLLECSSMLIAYTTCGTSHSGVLHSLKNKGNSGTCY